MERRGASILVPHTAGEVGNGQRLDRFGERTLLEMLVGELRGGLANIAVVPVGLPLEERIGAKLAQSVSLSEPCPETAYPASALGLALQLLPEDVEAVAVLTADLPYLKAAHLEQLFQALPPEADGVCVAIGEERHPLLGVYHREALEKVREAAGDADPWEGLRIQHLPAVQAEEAVGGTVGGTAGETEQGLTIASRVDSPQTYRDALTHHGFCDAAHPAVSLELYGNLRIRTGCGLLPLRADNVGRAFGVFRAVYPEATRWLPEHEALPEHFRFSINGGEVTTRLDHPLKESDQLILFSATVGG